MTTTYTDKPDTLTRGEASALPLEHTAGPWRAIDNYPNAHHSIPATVHVNSNQGWVEVAQLAGKNQSANARLIAAAPELLEALKLAITALDVNDKFGDAIDARHSAEEDAHCAACAAIAKAEGSAE